MLHLKRKAGQVIFIGKDIKLLVKSVVNGEVDIGIDAPRSVRIEREERLQKKTQPNRRETNGNK